MAADFTIKTGDTAPALVAVLRDADDEVVNLTGASVKFLMRSKATGELLAEGDVVIVDADEGLVRYQWSVGDTGVPGTHNGEFEVEWLDATIETFPNSRHLQIRVKSDLGGLATFT